MAERAWREHEFTSINERFFLFSPFDTDKTFLRYLLENLQLDFFLKRIDILIASKEGEVELKKEIQDEKYPQCVRYYMTKDDWLSANKKQLAQQEEEILHQQEQINKIWNEFINWTDNKNRNQEEEIRLVQEWGSALKRDTNICETNSHELQG